jgi:hypothetical protein
MGHTCGIKITVKLHKILHRALINKTGMIKMIMNVLSLGEVVATGMDVTSIPRKQLRGPKSDI